MQSFMTHNVIEVKIGKSNVKDKENGDSYLTKDITITDANNNVLIITCFSPDCVDMITKIEELQESFNWD